MKSIKRTIIVIVIIVLALAVGGGIAYYYNYENSHYITTDDAQISADMLTITPQITGAIQDWNVKAGDKVTKGEVLGTQETDTMLGSLASSAPANPAGQKAESELLASKSQIKAPIDGEVIQTTAIKGQLAAASTSLAVIADIANAYVTANIKEGNINDIKVGQKVDISIDAFPGKSFTGKVENIGRAAESVFSLIPSINSSGSFTKVTQLIPVKIGLTGTDGTDSTGGIDLMPGLNTTVKIYIK